MTAYEWMKKFGARLAAIPAMIAVVGGIMAVPGYVATPADLKQMKTELVTEFNKSMALERDISRLNNVNEMLLKARMQQRDYPKDKTIAEDIQTLKEDKVKLQERIEKR